ncbi:MAG: MotA/TolQ/ExbB proton channel family protein [Deltaproteobacteria bacterium]|nr:MotA/TolQ/ExbB proton channel family protein [Deltaproteobacteria bacterium]
MRSIVAAAPLAGLLGTVSGMIETFQSLGDMSLFSQSGGIAGGISQALITTQMGLAVAVPGMIAGRLLDRRQRFMEFELAQVKDLLCAGQTTEAA